MLIWGKKRKRFFHCHWFGWTDVSQCNFPMFQVLFVPPHTHPFFFFPLLWCLLLLNSASLPGGQQSHNDMMPVFFHKELPASCFFFFLNFWDKSWFGINLYKWKSWLKYSYKFMICTFSRIAHWKISVPCYHRPPLYISLCQKKNSLYSYMGPSGILTSSNTFVLCTVYEVPISVFM